MPEEVFYDERAFSDDENTDSDFTLETRTLSRRGRIARTLLAADSCSIRVGNTKKAPYCSRN
jgi:hypothetical protein